MLEKIGRRRFLQTTGVIGLGVGMLGVGTSKLWAAESATEAAKGSPNAEKLGWRLGCQAYSFKNFTLFEAIDKTASLGLKYIEAFPNQVISKDRREIQITESLPDDARKELKKKLGDCGVKLVNYGVCNLSKKEDDSRKVFDFAKDMGIETIVSEPPEEAMEMLDKLCAEYEMNIAIHNHPKHMRPLLESRHGAKSLPGTQPADWGLCRYGPLGAFGPESLGIAQKTRRPHCFLAL